MHGAATHFPIALVSVSFALDALGFALAGRGVVRDLHAAGYWTLLVGAVASIGAIASGIMLTRGQVLGHGALRMHHLFVWPAFGLMIALATWRAIIGRRATRGLFAGYLAGAALAVGLLMTAAYWGGELMLSTGTNGG